MTFKGVSKVFSTNNCEQYKTISEFWDKLSKVYGMENLRGLGFNWTENTTEYVLGLKSNEKFDFNFLEEGYVWKEIELPRAGWRKYCGLTNKLSSLYEDIYLEGKLSYEIEEFYNNGICEISINREIMNCF
jgi:hypothetical protein